MNDVQFLQWLNDRIVNVYGESPNVDFLLRLRNITGKVGDADKFKHLLRVMLDD